MPEQLLTANEAAERLQVKPDRVRAWIRSGHLRGIDLSSNPGTGNPRFRVVESDLQAFLAARIISPVKTVRRQRSHPTDVIEFFPKR
jgi:excisionase family DNA binding protein